MTDSTENFSHSATIFPVKDIASSLEFYTRKLGFENTFTWEDPPSYAVLKRGIVSIHLSAHPNRKFDPDQRCLMYIFVHDIEKIYNDCRENGVQIHSPLGDRDYQMRDFDILDPDGHLITFGNGE